MAFKHKINLEEAFRNSEASRSKENNSISMHLKAFRLKQFCMKML